MLSASHRLQSFWGDLLARKEMKEGSKELNPSAGAAAARCRCRSWGLSPCQATQPAAGAQTSRARAGRSLPTTTQRSRWVRDALL